MQVFSRLGSTVYTILKTKVEKAMIDTYPSISFSDEPSDKDPSFPNVFFQQLQPIEQGQTIDGNVIITILYCFNTRIVSFICYGGKYMPFCFYVFVCCVAPFALQSCVLVVLYP